MIFLTLIALLLPQVAGMDGPSIPLPAKPIVFQDGQAIQTPMDSFPSFPSIDHVAQFPMTGQIPASAFQASSWPSGDSYSTDSHSTSFVSNGQLVSSVQPDTDATSSWSSSENSEGDGSIAEASDLPRPYSFHSHDSRPPMDPLDGRRLEAFRNWLHRRQGCDYGVGYERVMYAPMVLDTAISTTNVGVRMRSDYGLGAPDRLEYVWARAGRGPDPETRLDLIDTVYRTEIANGKAGFITELGMRSLNPEINSNTVGFSDMTMGGKATVYDARCTKVSTLFLTHLNTGPTYRGLGTGHVSLEPGLLVRQQANDATFLHGELKYRLPIAGTTGFAGDVLSTGLGISTIWRDSDSYALIPTLEMRTLSFLFGGRTLPDGTTVRIDGTTAVELYPGMRCCFCKSSTGIWEFGVAGGTTFADRDWFDTRLMLDVRLIR